MNTSKRTSVLIALAAVLLLAIQPLYAASPSYTVTQGDTLYKIGLLFNTTSTILVKANNLTGTMIYPGQKLAVNTAVYTVKSGDTMYLISVKCGVTLDLLRKASGIASNVIYPGQILLLPGGANTAAAGSIAASTASTTTADKYVVPCTTAEFDQLARLVTAEAAGEPYQAQVAVAAVVINRVQAAGWPKTIHSVIYQVSDGYYQFTPVQNGMINSPATQLAKQATQDALCGSDPTKGATFYYDTSTTNKWLLAKPLAIKIGDMVYKYS